MRCSCVQVPAVKFFISILRLLIDCSFVGHHCARLLSLSYYITDERIVLLLTVSEIELQTTTVVGEIKSHKCCLCIFRMCVLIDPFQIKPVSSNSFFQLSSGFINRPIMCEEARETIQHK